MMNADKSIPVEVQYTNPKRDTIVRTVGWLRDGSQHILVIHGMAKHADLYTYSIIPRALVNKVTNLRVVDQ